MNAGTIPGQQTDITYTAAGDVDTITEVILGGLTKTTTLNYTNGDVSSADYSIPVLGFSRTETIVLTNGNPTSIQVS